VNRMKRLVLQVVLLGVALLALAAASSAATVRGIVPFVASGTPTCSQVAPAATGSATFSPPANGASSNGLFVLVNNSASFGWYVVPDIRDVRVRAVIVKGGPNSNVYVYAGGDYSDGPLTAPTNPKNGKPYDVGAATFCFTVGS
jgi:hypothetical protein